MSSAAASGIVTCIFSHAVSDVSDGDLSLQGSLGSLSLSDLTPHGDLYRERFTTRGGEALVFNIYKYAHTHSWLYKATVTS